MDKNEVLPPGNKATADFVITVTVPKNYKLAPDAD